jgi:hypothetical protein
MVEPVLRTEHAQPTWADRCYHLLFAEGMTISAGRQLYVNDARRFAFFGVATHDRQLCLRAAEPFSPGDDPDEPQVGGVRVEVVRPLKEIRIQVSEQEGFPLAADLTYRARFAPIPTERNRIFSKDELVTDYMNFFQSGTYSGTVSVDGVEHHIQERNGFRDRGWGIRKHESAGRRGFMAACFCELPDSAIYLIFYETASGRRVFTNGWLMDETGMRDVATGIDHDLTFEGRRVQHGQFRVQFATGDQKTIDFRAQGRIFLSGVGYSLDPELRATGAEVFDTTDDSVVERLDGQNDNGCTFTVDGQDGYGYVETGVGIHVRYRPE